MLKCIIVYFDLIGEFLVWCFKEKYFVLAFGNFF